MSVLPPETIPGTINEQPPSQETGPTTEPPKNGGALFEFFTGKKTLDPQTAISELEKKIVATKDEIKTIENDTTAKQTELLIKKNELVHLEQDIKREKGNVNAVLWKKTQGGKKSKKSKKSHKKTKKSHKKSSRKTR